MNLITGAAGHLGNVLVRELVKRGEPVRVLILPEEDTSSLEGLAVEQVEGNILDMRSLSSACAGVDAIFHMAALVSLLDKHAPALQKVNVEGTQNVIRAARDAQVRRFVYTSSIHALTRPPAGDLVNEELPFDVLNPAGAYDRTKAQASRAVLEAARSGLNAVIVCPTGVIGPYDFRRSEMGEMILDWILNPISWLIPGAFDFVDVRDVALGHIYARDVGQAGETYILGGQQISVKDLCKLVKDTAGKRLNSVVLPGKIALLAAGIAEWYYHIGKIRPRFTRYSVETLYSNSNVNLAKARIQLGYSPRAMSETITDTVVWWIENHRKLKASVRI